MELDVAAEHTFADCGIREVQLDGCRYEVDLSPIGLLGKGFQGEVRAAREVSSGLVVAAKLMKLDRRARTEARALSTCVHPSIAKLVGLWEATDSEHCVLLTELCDQGELFDTIVEYEAGLPADMARDFFFKITSALSHMHDKRVAHRDVKAENVLLDSRGNPKLIDMGLAFIEHEMAASGASDPNVGRRGLATTKVGSMMYAAPEVVHPRSEGAHYDPYAADMWSLGVLLYCMLQGLFPFRIAIAELCPAYAHYLERGTLPWRAPFPAEAAEAALRKLLCVSADERITARAALAEAWLSAPSGAPARPMPPAGAPVDADLPPARKRTVDELEGAAVVADGPDGARGRAPARDADEPAGVGAAGGTCVAPPADPCWGALRLVTPARALVKEEEDEEEVELPAVLAGSSIALSPGAPHASPCASKRFRSSDGPRRVAHAGPSAPASASGWHVSRGYVPGAAGMPPVPLLPTARSVSCDSAVAVCDGDATRERLAWARAQGEERASGSFGGSRHVAPASDASGPPKVGGSASVAHVSTRDDGLWPHPPAADAVAAGAHVPASGEGKGDGDGDRESKGDDNDNDDDVGEGDGEGDGEDDDAAEEDEPTAHGDGAGGAHDGSPETKAGNGGKGGGMAGGGSHPDAGARGQGGAHDADGGAGGADGGVGGGSGGGAAGAAGAADAADAGDAGDAGDAAGGGGGSNGAANGNANGRTHGGGGGGEDRGGGGKRGGGGTSVAHLAQLEARNALVGRICRWVLTHCDTDRDSIVLTDARGVALDGADSECTLGGSSGAKSTGGTGGNDGGACGAGSGGAPNRILAVTDAWCNLCGYTEAEAVGQSPRLTQGEATDLRCIAGMRDAINAGRACKVSVVNYRKGGHAFVNNLTLCPIRVRGRVVIYTGILRDYSTQLQRLVTLRPQQYFKMTTHYTASNGLIARPPAMPMLIDVDDEQQVGTEDRTDAVWQRCVVELHVKRLSFALKEREAEYLSLWLQDACATLNLPYAESVCEAGGREVICVTVQQGHLVCRGLILPVDEPGTHRVVFERLRGDPLAYHKLFKQIAQHMHEC